MKFEPVPIEEASGKLLGHNIYAPGGRLVLPKGKALSHEDILKLSGLGRRTVYVARIEAGDVDENQAALRIARAVAGEGVRLSRSAAGRVNLFASLPGILRCDVKRLEIINSFEGITLATLTGNRFVQFNQTLATVKIIPFAVSGELLCRAEESVRGEFPLLGIDGLHSKKVALVLFGAEAAQERLRKSFEEPLRTRLARYASQAAVVEYLSLEDEKDEINLSHTLAALVAQGMELLILAGDTAVMDRGDIAPRAIERAGGSVECVGVPVDPGNLLMLAYLGEVPILGAPGCARSLKTNAIDWVLPRLLAGEHLRRSDMALLGHGGLLQDTSKRPMPRRRTA